MSKGAFKYEGGRSLSNSRPNLSGKGRMSGAHGTNTGNPAHGMTNPQGRLGSDCRPFRSDAYTQAGPKANGHATQPSGHKSKA